MIATPRLIWSELAIVVLAVLGTVSCTVRESTPDSISVEYDALHPEFGQIEADRHCQQYGKTAVLVSTRPVGPSLSTMMLNSTVGTYRCAGGTASGDAGRPPGVR